MHIFIEREQQHLEQKFTGTAQELLKELNINPQTVLIIKDGTLITEDETITDAKKLELLTVVSGG